jgi:crotonobetainyl-CoA:carnitine CoA-transferase CaiB-like acyl-CoA transferase
MENFGLGYDILSQVNPAIIMISLPAHGTTGPWRNYPGYAHSIEQTSGIPQLTGYSDGDPKMTASGFTDPVAGVNGMAAVMIALLYRQATGNGQYIDLSQVEVATSMIGSAIIDFTMNKRIQQRIGNHHPFMAPHGYYRCKGDDAWVAIAIGSDEEWHNFVKAIGEPEWAKETRFQSSLGRWQNQDELDRLIEAWTVQHDHYEVMHLLQNAGVAAGAVLSSSELLSDPHLLERGTFQCIDRALVGVHPYPIPTAPERLSRCPTKIRRPAPLLGEHNDYVLGELLGMSRKQITYLTEQQIIGSQPLGV